MRFKTQPMAHQLEGLRRSEGRDYFAYLMEQGTGKTKTTIDDAARSWREGKFDGLIVFAPNGVHTNWVTIELPKHMPDDVPFVAGYYLAGASKRHQATVEALFAPTKESEPRPLRILAINYDALTTADGKKLVERFIAAFRCGGIVDESQRIKNPDAKRTMFLLKKRKVFVWRRILTGTPVTKAPFDVFGQFSFLSSSILRTDSFRAFKSEYAEMLSEKHYLVRKMQAGAWAKKDGTPSTRVPMIQKTDAITGLPIYKNLDKLNRLIANHSYRVLKSECLDLPEKIYTVIPFAMTPKQEAMYEKMKKELRADVQELIDNLTKAAKREHRDVDTFLTANRQLIVQNKLVAMAKLQQIASGYIKLEDGQVVRIFDDPLKNPRNIVMLEAIEDIDGSVILWAPHRDKIDQIIECLSHAYPNERIIRYDGKVGKEERRLGIDAFQAGDARFFVGNPQSGATGITLTKSENTIYYSNSFDAEHRWQSEDRNHRIGTTSHVRYQDIQALGTVDFRIAASLRAKKQIADDITGDSEL